MLKLMLGAFLLVSLSMMVWLSWWALSHDDNGAWVLVALWLLGTVLIVRALRRGLVER